MDENNVKQNLENTNAHPTSDTLNQTQQVNEPIQNTQQIEQPVNQTQPINVQPQYIIAKNDEIPEEYKPISMWGYFGYELLFAIPLVGFILILVFSFGGARNINLRNFARSYFCFLIIGVIIFLVIFIFMLIVFGGAAGLSSIGSSSASEAARTIY